jgi:hypothetical protein
MRVVTDCREFPSESGCSLTISGEEDEVVRAAAQHAVAVHGHEDGPQLQASIRATLRPEAGARTSGFGTVMTGRLAESADGAQLVAALERWEESRRVPGFLAAQVLVADDGRTVVSTALFRDKGAYDALAADPEQDTWYRRELAPLLDAEPAWVDGTWEVYVRRPAIVLPEQEQPRAPVNR